MELRHLRYFVTVAEELHFGKAAQRLNIAQPPLSMQIQQLEQEIGAPLFIRNKRQVSLTDAGKLFLRHAEQILDHVGRACDLARLVHNGEVGQIIVGFAGGTTYNLMQLQKGFMQQFPNAEFILRRLGTTDQVHALHDKKIHIGLLYPPVGSNKLNMMTLARQQILAALPHTHPLAGVEGPIEVSALARESFIMPPRIAGPSYYDTLHHICYRAGFVPKIVLEVYELETIVSLVSEALGVSLVPSLFRHYQINGVVYKELTETTPVLETSLAWRSDEMTAIVLTFIQFVKEWKGSSDHIY